MRVVNKNVEVLSAGNLHWKTIQENCNGNIRFPNALALSSSLVVVNPVHGKYDKYRKGESTTDKRETFSGIGEIFVGCP